MTKPNHCPFNERIKRRYFLRLKETRGYSVATVDGVAAAISRFESFTGYKDFKKFHLEQVRAFKRYLLEQAKAVRSGQGLSAATISSTLRSLKAFFEWLADQPGYRSKITYSDAEYFTPPAQQERIAAGRIERPGPELDALHKVLAAMPHETQFQKRDRAVFALIMLTGARDKALISLRLKHLDLEGYRLIQDARQVKTKRNKTIVTTFFPIGGEALAIVTEWKSYLVHEMSFGPEAPLFPATLVGLDANGQFAPQGLESKPWVNTAQVRKIFQEAFQRAGLAYHNPHSIRSTLARLGEQLCQTPEDFKSWSQNLGHTGVLTTFTAYGNVAPGRQAEIIKNLGQAPQEDPLATKIAQLLRDHKVA